MKAQRFNKDAAKGGSAWLDRFLGGILVFAFVMGFSVCSVHADEVRMYKPGEVPTAEGLAQELFPDKGATGGVKTRGIVIHDEKPAATAAPKAVGFNIGFKFDSTEMVGNYRDVLDQVAAMMRSDAARGEVLVVEGHTDAVGNPAYNRRLSERRAQAVKNYLVQRGVESQRLRVEGKGMSELLPGYAGDDGINRRVQFRRAD